MANAQQTSSCSDTDSKYAMMDEKKRKRMISNRESARRSRLKKQKQMEDTVHEISSLQMKIKENNAKCTVLSQTLDAIESENTVLKSEKARLETYMSNLEMIVTNLTHDGDQNMEIGVVDCRRPWQVGVSVSSDGCGYVQPITSSGFFQT